MSTENLVLAPPLDTYQSVVCVAMDFSPASDQALNWALQNTLGIRPSQTLIVLLHVAPKIPPDNCTDLTAMAHTLRSRDEVASVTSKHSNPLSPASLIVVCTHTSVVNPQKIKFVIP